MREKPERRERLNRERERTRLRGTESDAAEKEGE
jgi:hypothetical protein